MSNLPSLPDLPVPSLTPAQETSSPMASMQPDPNSWEQLADSPILDPECQHVSPIADYTLHHGVVHPELELEEDISNSTVIKTVETHVKFHPEFPFQFAVWDHGYIQAFGRDRIALSRKYLKEGICIKELAHHDPSKLDLCNEKETEVRNLTIISIFEAVLDSRFSKRWVVVTNGMIRFIGSHRDGIKVIRTMSEADSELSYYTDVSC